MTKLKSQRIDFDQINRFVASAAKKLTAAKKTLDIDEEASYQLAYESMLKASLGFMLSFGVRPRSLPGHHVTIIQFVERRLGEGNENLVAMFDRMRRKRHQAIYDITGLISRQEAQHALEIAENYLATIRRAVTRGNP